MCGAQNCSVSASEGCSSFIVRNSGCTDVSGFAIETVSLTPEAVSYKLHLGGTGCTGGFQLPVAQNMDDSCKAVAFMDAGLKAGWACGPDKFVFTTYGLYNCSVAEGYGASSLILDATPGSCTSPHSSTGYKTVYANASAVGVEIFPDETCSGQSYYGTWNLPADGSCFGVGSADGGGFGASASYDCPTSGAAGSSVPGGAATLLAAVAAALAAAATRE
jgi:hypothetical protein